MKPLAGTFLDLCGDALPGALVHVRAHRSLQHRVYEMPLGYSHTVCPVWQHDAVGRGTLRSLSMADTVAARGSMLPVLACFPENLWKLKTWIFHCAWEIPTLIYNYMIADRLLRTTNSPLKLPSCGKPGVKVPYHLLLSPLITIKHCSQCYFFNIGSPHHENEP